MIDLFVLPLSQIDVILGMDCLSSNHISLNCFENFVVFPESSVSEGDMFLFANQVETSLRKDAQVYMILASMSAETKTHVREVGIGQSGITSIFDGSGSTPFVDTMWPR